MAPPLVWNLSASPHSIPPTFSSLFRCPCSRLSFSQSLSAATVLRSLLFKSRFPLSRGSCKRFFCVQSVAVTGAAKTQKKGAGSKGPPKPRKRMVLLKPPLDDTRLAEKFLNSPQLTLKSFPLLSACLPPAPFNRYDHAWMDENLLEAKDALGLASYEAEEGTQGEHLDSLLYLAFQHSESARGRRTPHIRTGHSRLWFLGQYVVELALAELFLQMFPRETTGSLRERVFGLTSKKVLPEWIKAASMDRLVFPDEDMDGQKRDVREPAVRSVFWAVIGALYLTLGMPEVYRLLFEVFGMDVDDKSCQPKLRALEDEDFLSPELDGKRLTWQDIAFYQPPEGTLFAEPRLFRACVPPGMHRFRGNVWEGENLPIVMRALGYPLRVGDSSPEATAARKVELELGLQLCFSTTHRHNKLEHPRFCNERLEYLGQKIQDVIMAEKLVDETLDGPGLWLEEKHRRLLMNRLCGRYLRDKKLQYSIIYADERKEVFDRARRLRNFATTAVSQAIHGLGYVGVRPP